MSRTPVAGGLGEQAPAPYVSQGTLAERLRLVRGSLTQEQFAARVGVHKQTIWRYEKTGRDISSDLLAGVCLAFEIEPMWLLLGLGPMQLTMDDAQRQVWELRRQIWEKERAESPDQKAIDDLWRRVADLSNKISSERRQSGGGIGLAAMAEIIEAAEKFLRDERLDLSPQKKAQLFVTLYELIRVRGMPEAPGPIDLSEFKNVIRLAR